MKRIVLCIVFGMWQIANLGFAITTEVDPLIEKLQEKGILTAEESKKLKDKIMEDEKIKTDDEVNMLLPKWVKNMNWKGDFRLRNEIQKSTEKSRVRERFRLRFGFDSLVNDYVNFGLGVATGSDDSPISTNQTLEQEFQKKPLWIDYAYIKYTPITFLSLQAGRIQNPFVSTDMVWDSDINFDGAALSFKSSLNTPESRLPIVGSFVAGFFPIDENSKSPSDIWLIGLQPQVETTFDNIRFKTTLAYYDYINLGGYPLATLAEEIGTNSTVGEGDTKTMKYDYNILNPNVELEFSNPYMPVTLLGDFAFNTSLDDVENALRGGIAFGKKVKGQGDLRLLTQYTRIEKDALYDAFPDSDFDGGGTNAKGFEIILDYGLFKNIVLSVDYYNTKAVSGTAVTEHLVQTDLVFKF
jgi:polyhydroxyalkanoate synthesis regulator phasin